MAIVNPHRLLEALCAEPRESEWLEFKINKFEPDEVGRYVSGLANAAMLEEKDRAYLIFGVHNETHEIVGTEIVLKDKKIGEQVFEHWLARFLDPRITLEFISIDYDDKRVEMVVIDPGYISPVRFKTEAYVRIDSVQQPLREYRDRERAIWSITSRFSFEQGIAAAHLSEDEIFERFDCGALLARLNSQKASRHSVLDQLMMEDLIVDNKQGGFDVTNLLAIAAAKDLSQFPSLQSKAPRVIQYAGSNKLNAVSDTTGVLGYGVTFTRLLRFIMDRLPVREEILHGVRHRVLSIPEKAIREFLANALIHQDLTSTADGPREEIFSDKIDITNPGKPLISPDRFIDAPSKSRNEKLTNLMRRLGLCEARGSGVDRALDAIEDAALPPPLFQSVESSTVVTVYGERTFAAMAKEERVRACYQHASLKFENGSMMSNASLRSRFGLTDRQYPQVSTVIRETIDIGLVRPMDEDQAKRTARYLSWWA